MWSIMPDKSFEAAVEEAKEIEGSASPYTPYKGKIEFIAALDLNPKEYSECTYNDMIILFERAEKIMKASSGLIQGPAVGAAKESPVMKKEIAIKKQEVESKVKELTSQALTTAQELGKELEKTPMEKREFLKPPVESKPQEEIEFDILAKPEMELEKELKKEVGLTGFEFEREIEKEKTSPDVFEIEKESPEEKKEEISLDILEEKETGEHEIDLKGNEGEELETEERVSKKEGKERIEERAKTPKGEENVRPKFVAPKEKQILGEAAPEKTPLVPPILRERAEVAAAKKYGEIEQQILSTLGGEVDETSLKKKMLDLTKELFKEKSMQRREGIKLEITVIKDMLSRKVKAAPKKGVSEKEARGRLLETLISMQMTELTATKEKILSTYKNRMDVMKQTFQDEIASIPEDDEKGRKSAYEKLIFGLTAINEQVPGIATKYQDYIAEKHDTEMKKLRSALGKGEERIADETDERIRGIPKEYQEEFSKVKLIVKKQTDALSETSGRVVFKKEKAKSGETMVAETVGEINDTDEGTLLYYLHTKDPEYYKGYERKHLSKQEAIFRAKEMMAREKGLSDGMVRKYFSSEA